MHRGVSYYLSIKGRVRIDRKHNQIILDKWNKPIHSPSSIERERAREQYLLYTRKSQNKNSTSISNQFITLLSNKQNMASNQSFHSTYSKADNHPPQSINPCRSGQANHATNRAMEEPSMKRRLARCSCTKNAQTIVFEENMRKTMSSMPGLRLL